MKWFLFCLSLASVGNVLAPCNAAYAQTNEPQALPVLKANEAGDLRHFLGWLAGEYDNNEQVWQQKQEAGKTATGIPENPFPHVHQLISAIDAPTLGSDVYMLQTRNASVSMQSLMRFSWDSKSSSIRQENLEFVDESKYAKLAQDSVLAGTLSNKQVKLLSGCDVYWRFQPKAQNYTASLQGDTCKRAQGKGKNVSVRQSMSLSETEFSTSESTVDAKGSRLSGRADGVPLRKRKVRYFTGWAYVNRSGKAARESDTKFSFQKDIVIHNEGQRVPLLFDDGKPTGYSIELAQLTYQETKTPILKLALIDNATDTSATYVWSSTDASKIGMNLKWLQVGLTEKPERVHFGFDPKP
jgi:hypothetical protein